MMGIPYDGYDDSDIRRFLQLKKVAVIGMSRNPSKAAHFVPMYLKDIGYEIIPINPMADEIAGMKVYKSILDVDDEIDIVDVFRPSEETPDVVKEAVEKRPKVIWLQEGIYHPEAVRIAREAGIDIVWNRCMMREHKRLFGR
jgi:hypothetical protein